MLFLVFITFNWLKNRKGICQEYNSPLWSERQWTCRYSRKWKLEHPKYNKAEAYNQLERHEQVVIFRLRTNHNKLKQHLYRTFKVGDTDQCLCGEEAQTAEHILQRCELYKELRVRTWPQPTLETQKLYGCLRDLQRTAAFISETGIPSDVWEEEEEETYYSLKLSTWILL